MKTVVSVLFVLFVLPTVCTIALADAVPGALLYLDARDNRAHPTAWTNPRHGWWRIVRRGQFAGT